MSYLGHCRWLGLTAAAAAVLATATAVKADPAANYPDKPITVVVGFAAGGGNDTYARALAAVSDKYLGQPLVVVNQPGGAQVPAMRTTARAKPDGYSAAVVSAGTLVLSGMLRDHGVNLFEDFKIIGQIGVLYPALLAPKPGPFKTPQEIIEAAKANPGKLRWAHPGRGTFPYLAGIGWLQANGIENLVQDVPFVGGSPARVAVVGKQVDFGVTGLGSAAGFEEELEIIAVIAGERDPLRTEVISMKEHGSPFVEIFSPVMVIVPRDTPDAIVDKFSAALGKMVADATYQKITRQASLAPEHKNAKEARAMMENLRPQWEPVMARIKAQQEKAKN